MKTLKLLFAALFLLSGQLLKAQGNVYEFNNNAESRWSSPENINGIKGQGGKENYGAKGHPSDSIAAHSSRTLLDIQATGVINLIRVTISDRSPQMLRSLKIEIFW